MSRMRSFRRSSWRSLSGFQHRNQVEQRRPEPLEPRWLLAADSFVELHLSSDQPGTALVTDPTLGFAWGLATSPGANGGFSISNPSAQQSNAYGGDVAGSPFVPNASQNVDVPLPTGQVYNGNTGEFILSAPPTTASNNSSPPATAPAEFIYASLNGNLYGSNPSLGKHAVLAARPVTQNGTARPRTHPQDTNCESDGLNCRANLAILAVSQISGTCQLSVT